MDRLSLIQVREIKREILIRVIEEVEAQMRNMERGRLDAVEESKAHKGAMESRFDTFKEEAQYLAGGFHARWLELARTMHVLCALKDDLPTMARCASCAMVEAQNLEDGTKKNYFFLPAGGGGTYKVAGKTMTVLHVGSPIARAFIGAIVGEEIECYVQGTLKRYMVISVA